MPASPHLLLPLYLSQGSGREGPRTKGRFLFRMAQLLFLEKMHKECPSRGAGCPKDRSGWRRVESGRKCAWSGYNFQQCGRFHTDLSALATPDEQSVDSLAVVGAEETLVTN